jgi:DNA-binding response OmpR family regulator
MADRSLARMVTFALEQMRLEHVHYESGSEALAALLEMHPEKRPPVLVLDVDLPGMDGHAILERLAVDHAGSFLIVVLSSHADESMQVRSLSAGAVDHIGKPFNVRVLMAKIQRLVSLSMRVSRMPRRRATDFRPVSG